eukprot:gene39-56_t
MILPHLWNEKKTKQALLLTFAFIGIDILLSTSFPYIWKDLISAPITAHSITWFIQKSAFLFIAWFFTKNSSHLKELAFFPVINQTTKSLRLEIILKVHATSLKNLETYKVQEIISATSRISQGVRSFMHASFVAIFPSIVKVVSLSIALCTADKLCFVMVISAYTGLVAALLALQYYQHAKYKAWHLADNVTSLMAQHVDNTATFRFHPQNHSVQLKKLFNLEAHAWETHNLWFYLLYLIQDSIFFIGTGITFCWLTFQYLQGNIDAGKMTLIYGIIASIHSPLSGIIRNLTRFTGSIIDINKALDILHMPSENRTLQLPSHLLQPIQLNQISFGYSGQEALLTHLTLTIHPGDKIGISGSSGSGKSTLCKIIAGLILPDQGTVLYGNVPIHQIHPVALGQVLIYIPQINPMQRLLEEHHYYGINLKKITVSGGEYQLALLREVLQQGPQMIILDEALNALDERTAINLLTEIVEKVPTVILISHSPTLLKQMKRIFERKGPFNSGKAHAPSTSIGTPRRNTNYYEIQGACEPGGIRTPNRYIRSVVLYPVELQVLIFLTNVDMNKILRNKLVIALLFFALPTVNFANVDPQVTESKVKPDYEVPFEEDEYPADMPLNYMTLVSEASQLVLYYNIPIRKSHFMANCGIGVSHSHYAFQKDHTLGRKDDISRATDIMSIVQATNIKATGDDLKSSIMAFRTVKIALEFRFNSNKEEPQDGFFLSAGGSIGLNFTPSATISYQEDKETKVQTTSESFNLNNVHYGIIARTGWSRYGIFYQQTFSPIFTAGKGPKTEKAFPFWIGVGIKIYLPIGHDEDYFTIHATRKSKKVPRTAFSKRSAGPGRGALTSFLVEKKLSNLFLIEVDHDLIPYLQGKYPTLSQHIVEADFLTLDLAKRWPGPIGVIGNFPYNISSPIFFRLLHFRDQVQEVVCMVQKEVAERLTASPNSKAYGIPSVLLQAFYHIEYLFTVGPELFIPPPKVHSAVIRLRRNHRLQLPCQLSTFFTLVKTSFQQRRKQLRNALHSFTLPDSIRQLPCMDKRAEALSVEDFIQLAQTIDQHQQKKYQSHTLANTATDLHYNSLPISRGYIALCSMNIGLYIDQIIWVLTFLVKDMIKYDMSPNNDNN